MLIDSATCTEVEVEADSILVAGEIRNRDGAGRYDVETLLAHIGGIDDPDTEVESIITGGGEVELRIDEAVGFAVVAIIEEGATNFDIFEETEVDITGGEVIAKADAGTEGASRLNESGRHENKAGVAPDCVAIGCTALILRRHCAGVGSEQEFGCLGGGFGIGSKTRCRDHECEREQC